jgi:hypothetical protein
MTTQTIKYRTRTGVKTRAPLRRLSTQDQDYLKTVLSGYLILSEWDTRPDFKLWFNTANLALPVQPQQQNKRNSPDSFCTGVLDKLNQPAGRTDLSPVQCDAIEALSQQIKELYNDQCPDIKFQDAAFGTNVNQQFGDLFKKLPA